MYNPNGCGVKPTGTGTRRDPHVHFAWETRDPQGTRRDPRFQGKIVPAGTRRDPRFQYSLGKIGPAGTRTDLEGPVTAVFLGRQDPLGPGMVSNLP